MAMPAEELDIKCELVRLGTLGCFGPSTKAAIVATSSRAAEAMMVPAQSLDVDTPLMPRSRERKAAPSNLSEDTVMKSPQEQLDTYIAAPSEEAGGTFELRRGYRIF
ncbi:hypothetical protein LTR10_005089 [Elasticomyces elasticus]|nr:hypothetical protein LTR10_005089 [Elasticomyces elasticus]KAK4975830.1 hypothetical protein LTR42_003451 [Elasticomyces elasticus]